MAILSFVFAFAAGAFISTQAGSNSQLKKSFGWVGFDLHPAGVWRIVGFMLMVAGVILIGIILDQVERTPRYS
jgi:uncharacterized membrane protein YdcZ (DUF606 family)